MGELVPAILLHRQSIRAPSCLVTIHDFSTLSIGLFRLSHWNPPSEICPAPLLAAEKTDSLRKYMIKTHLKSLQKKLLDYEQSAATSSCDCVEAYHRSLRQTRPNERGQKAKIGQQIQSGQNGYRPAGCMGQGFGFRFERAQGMPGAQSLEAK